MAQRQRVKRPVIERAWIFSRSAMVDAGKMGMAREVMLRFNR
jgi:hypothetical protein